MTWVGQECYPTCPYEKQGKRELAYVKRGCTVTLEAGSGMVKLQIMNADSHQKLQEGRNQFPTELLWGYSSVDALILDFWPPGLREKPFMLH